MRDSWNEPLHLLPSPTSFVKGVWWMEAETGGGLSGGEQSAHLPSAKEAVGSVPTPLASQHSGGGYRRTRSPKSSLA